MQAKEKPLRSFGRLILSQGIAQKSAIPFDICSYLSDIGDVEARGWSPRKTPEEKAMSAETIGLILQTLEVAIALATFIASLRG